jgi:hypothetical protein
MNKLIVLTLMTLMIVVTVSCDNELVVIDDWTEVPVVYGLLDPQSSEHVVRVTRAFLGEGSALEMAQIPDSSYYGDELTVRLIEILPSGSWNRTWDLDTFWIHDKKPGTFYSGDQMLYRVNANLDMNNNYMLLLRNLNTGLQASGTTSLVEPIEITKPRGGQLYFSFTSLAETQVEFKSAPNGRVYQLVIRFHYKEVDINTNDTTSHYVDWAFPNKKASYLAGNERIIYSFPGSAFYGNIQAQLKAKDGIKRLPENIDFIAYAGGDELSTYIDITAPSTSIVQERPQYTNINNGIGIFSSRTSATTTTKLTPGSIDSLVNGSRTRHLGFVFSIP